MRPMLINATYSYIIIVKKTKWHVFIKQNGSDTIVSVSKFNDFTVPYFHIFPKMRNVDALKQARQAIYNFYKEA